MISQSYATDTQAKAVELANTIQAATSPQQIAFACSSVEAFLSKHTPDQTRWFFSNTFQTLIREIFGFNDSVPASASYRPPPPAGWIDIASSSNDSELAGRIFSLLSPNGVLLSSITAVDRLSLVKYLFPTERLPGWARYMLQNERDSYVLADLCPLFKNRVNLVKGSGFQVHLNVFEYYIFWFAYYPVCRGNNEGSQGARIGTSKKFILEKWTSSIPVFSSTKRGTEHKNEGNLYARLLHAYLRSYVPAHDLSTHQPYRSSLLHYSSGYDGTVIERAEFLVMALIHFWLVDNDFSPLPMSALKSFNVLFPFRSLLGETPPVPSLGDVVNVFIKYLNLNSPAVTKGVDQVEFKASSCIDFVKTRDAALNMQPISAWNSWIQRPLYRFILRTFLFCPVETSIKNVSQVFSLWVNYLEPWKIKLEDFVELDANVGRSTKYAPKEATLAATNDYSSSWQDYVLANYLFYNSLVIHFIGFAHKFLHTDAEVVVQMVSKVIGILTSSEELISLIKNVDTVYHSKPAGPSKSMLNSLFRYVPMIREQLQDWEDGLCESDADGSFLHENWNKDLRLFSDREDGGQQLLQLFVLRAKSELQATSGESVAQKLQHVESLEAQVSCLYGDSMSNCMGGKAEGSHWEHLQRDEIFSPRSFGNRMVRDVKYKGDWMKRPISDDEVAWLVKLLVKVSGWVNELLGLNEEEVDSSDERAAWTYVDVSSDSNGVLRGGLDVMKMVIYCLVSVVGMLGGAGVKLMKKHGIRVNLRILASKKMVMMLLIMVAVLLVKRAFA